MGLADPAGLVALASLHHAQEAPVARLGRWSQLALAGQPGLEILVGQRVLAGRAGQWILAALAGQAGHLVLAGQAGLAGRFVVLAQAEAISSSDRSR